jgi:hypothetical protein
LRISITCGLFAAAMASDPSKLIDEPAPELTPERARELLREGADAAEQYRRRVEKMWTISKEQRQAKTR